MCVLPIDTTQVTRMPWEPYWCRVKMDCTKMDLRFVDKAAQFALPLSKAKYIQWLALLFPDWHSRC